MIVQILCDKFDCFLIIEGNRGLGKSTLAYKIAKKVSYYFRLIAHETGGRESPFKDYFRFKPNLQLKNKKEKFLLYTRDEVINFFNKWNKTAIADEMINVSFNREFWNDDQKNLIKIINMNRDHRNLFIACVPQFQTLDNQIKNLCRIRISVLKRGIAIIQTPNKTIYSKDKWDSANNEKIEREWLMAGSKRPKYAKLTTFRGVLKFKPLSETEDKIYQAIKRSERNIIKKDLGVKDEQDEEIEDIVVERLMSGGVKNMQIIEGIAFANGMTLDQFKGKIRRKLQELGKNPAISTYLWDKKRVHGEEMEQDYSETINNLAEKL